MKKVLILGAQGMLGKALTGVFSVNEYKVTSWDKKELDITKEKEVKEKILNLKPDFIINAAAYTDVDGAEKEKALAMKINGEAVKYLAQASKEAGAFLVHISTDYVFGAEKKEGYNEEDIPEKPLNVYGESKLLGEKLLLKEAQQDLRYYLIRTSWLFGQGGDNFVKTMLKLASQKKDLRVVDDQWGKPTFAYDLAQTIENMVKDVLPSGIYHFTNEPVLSWYKFARLIFKVKKSTTPAFLLPKVFPVRSEEFSRPAPRPHYSILNNTKLTQGRHVKKALREYFKKKV